MSEGDDLIDELIFLLESCPLGKYVWSKFEQVSLRILTLLFVPPLRRPYPQPRTIDGTERRDAAFPNWVLDTSNIWGLIRSEYGAKFILFEFKNYSGSGIRI